jgi:hypothetical protein
VEPQVLAFFGFVLTTRVLLNPADAPGAWMHFAGCGAVRRSFLLPSLK